MRILTVALALALFVNQQAQAGQVWLCGLDPVTRARKDPGRDSDFMALFAPNAPWAEAARKVNVFKISTAFVLQGTDADLRATFAGLKARGIALAVETGVLSGNGYCGKGMEGFSNAATALTIARRIQRLGGDLAYVAMDEQLWFGHFANNADACHEPIPDIAREVARHVAEMRSIFPNLRVGAIEPITDALPADALRQYLDAYRAVSGTPFAFLHGDVQWLHPWQIPMLAASQLARKVGVPFGVIIISDHPQDSVDAVWTAHARERLAAVRAVTSPDDLVFQSWTRAPSHWLPENEDGTLTNLVKDAP